MKFALSLIPLLLAAGLAHAAEPAPGTEINALMRVMKKDGSTPASWASTTACPPTKASGMSPDSRSDLVKTCVSTVRVEGVS